MSVYAELLERTNSSISVRRSRYETKQVDAIGNVLLEPSNEFAHLETTRSSRARTSWEQFHDWVYASVNAIATRLASQPCMAGEIMESLPNEPRAIGKVSVKLNGESKLADLLPARIIEKAAPSGDVEVLTDHPILDVLSRPNPIQRWYEFLWFSACNILITGESYWVAGVTEENRVEVWPVPTHLVTPLHEGQLFSGIKVTLGPGKSKTYAAENFTRIYIPDPTDHKAALSPLSMIIRAARVDDHILRSQEQTFERGIFPDVALVVGQNLDAQGRPTGQRPVLTGAQRRQLIRAVRQIWNQTVNAGDPAILDGLIEKVEKLSTVPKEMDWRFSGEAIKKRIMQAYRTNPYVLGDVTGVNRAQAVVAQSAFADQAVNPLGNQFSSALMDFLGPMWDEPARLAVWIEKWTPDDAELEFRKWQDARRHGDVTPDEYRQNMLGLGPIEETAKTGLAQTVGGISGAVNIMRGIAEGAIPLQAAANLFVFFFGMAPEEANAIVGASGAALDVGGDELVGENERQLVDRLVKSFAQQTHLKQVENHERRAGRLLASFFQRDDSAGFLSSKKAGRKARPQQRRIGS